MARHLPLLRIIVPTLWLGMILALSFIEPALKFQAPGITVPLGLGIGRLTFMAMAISGWTLLVILIAISVRREMNRGDAVTLAVLGIVLAVQSFVVRPPLNARSDIILAGGDPGESVLHYLYIATEVALFVVLVVWVVRACRNVSHQHPVSARP